MATPSRTKLLAAFAAVYLLWGSTFLAIRYGVATIPPFFMAGTRHLVAGALLYPFARLRGAAKPTRPNWLAAIIIGGLLLLIGNGGVSWAERTVPSGIAALLVATVALWIVILDWLRPGGRRPTAGIFIGLALGFSGLILLVGPTSPAGDVGAGSRVSPIGAGVLVFGSLCWAAGSVFSRQLQLPREPLLGTAMSSLAGGLMLYLFGAFTGELSDFHWAQISMRSALAVGYLAVFGSMLGFSAYTWLLRAAPPARVATYAYVNPIVAMILGWALAGERVTLRTFLAAAVIIAGVVLVITARQHASAPSKATQPLPAEPIVEPEDVKV